MGPIFIMRESNTFFRHILLALAILLLAGCNHDRYKPINDNFDDLLRGQTAVDTVFVATITAKTAADFDSCSVKFLQVYDRDFDDPGLREFCPATLYTVRQDSILFLMQDYLLNTYRYEESIALGSLLDEWLRYSNTPLHSAALGDIAVAYFYMGNLQEAIKYQSDGYEIDMRLNDPQLMSSDLNQLAAMCLRSGQYDLARDYILDAIKVELPLQRSAPLAIRYGLASEIFLKLNDYTTAADYARKALELDRCDGREAKVGIRLSQLAAIQLAQNDDAAAEVSLAQALPILQSSNNINSLAIANCQLGELALRRDSKAKAQQYFNEALLMCRSAGIKPIEKRALHGLWLSMKDANQADAAKYLEHYSELSDSLSIADSDLQLANLKAEFATRELRLQNERLESQNRTNRIILISSAMLLLLIGLVGWLIYRNRTSRQRLMHNMEQVRINFFTNITHEFRTPLTVILGISSELEKHEPVRQQAEVITQEGRNLLSLVNQLLDIGKISSSAGHAQWRHGNVIGYLNMLVESLRPLAVSRSVELVFSPANNDVEMDFVPDYMRKIVVNILSNALKYTGAEGRVLISARVDGAQLVLRFADNGSGIAVEDLEHIFEPFYQGANSKVAVGTGVGLSLVKLLVKVMGGEISVKSSLGIGSVFILTLPLKHSGKGSVEPFDTPETIPLMAPDTEVDEIPGEDETTGVRRRPAVLIVEDNVNVANYIASQLSDRYQIHMARNGEEGYNKALNLVPDLIVTDIMMPVMDGIELLKRMRQSDILNHLPVVMVTARASDNDRIEGISSGADAYITKPFNADELRAVADRLIEQRRLLCEKYRTMAEYIVANSTPEDSSNEDRVFIGRLINVIYHLISSGKRTDIAELASCMHTSDRSLARKVQALTGESTVAFVNRVKIDKAKRMLASDDTTPMSDIAMRCGFEDPAYFSRIFKQNEGVSPTTYRRNVR